MKILYIIVNSKSEEESSSRKVSRELINMLMKFHPESKLEELNLYENKIPRLEARYFESRNCIVQRKDSLTQEENDNVDRINELVNQFISADVYIIAAPLWNMSFPSPLKEYLDCIIQQGKTIDISEKGVKGLLSDKERRMIYVQSSGGHLPIILKNKMSQGIKYVEDLMNIIGIKKFEELLVDGTGFTVESKREAEEKAIAKILPLLKSFRK